MSAPNSGPCELLPWDTDFFGCRLARVHGDTLGPEQAAKIDDWSRSNQICGLYFLARANAPATIETAERHSFGLVDIRVTFEHRLKHPPLQTNAELPPGTRIRGAQPVDLPRLQTLARLGHRGTRFFNDSHFPRRRVEELYSTWIALEVQGRAQAVFVCAGEMDQPLGYLSCHWNAACREGQIGLVGVSAEARGRGLGRNLVGAALDWFSVQGAHKVSVVTQGNNGAAQRLYEQCGFLSHDLQLWYHKWYPSGNV